MEDNVPRRIRNRRRCPRRPLHEHLVMDNRPRDRRRHHRTRRIQNIRPRRRIPPQLRGSTAITQLPITSLTLQRHPPTTTSVVAFTLDEPGGSTRSPPCTTPCRPPSDTSSGRQRYPRPSRTKLIVVPFSAFTKPPVPVFTFTWPVKVWFFPTGLIADSGLIWMFASTNVFTASPLSPACSSAVARFKVNPPTATDVEARSVVTPAVV